MGASRENMTSRYYDHLTDWYRLFYSPTAMHYGYWTPGTRTLGRALRNHKALVHRALALEEGSHLLDAGCGHGSTAAYLAAQAGCRVTGITLSRRQVEIATRRARRLGLEGRLGFRAGDYCATGLPEHSFTHVCAVESVCHARRPELFLAEAARLLCPGGRLVVVDFFREQPEETFSAEQRRLYDQVRRGFVLPGFACRHDFLSMAASRGLVLSEDQDLSRAVAPTARAIRRRARLALPFALLLHVLRLVPEELPAHLRSCLVQPRALEVLGTYRLLVFDRAQ